MFSSELQFFGYLCSFDTTKKKKRRVKLLSANVIRLFAPFTSEINRQRDTKYKMHEVCRHFKIILSLSVINFSSEHAASLVRRKERANIDAEPRRYCRNVRISSYLVLTNYDGIYASLKHRTS